MMMMNRDDLMVAGGQAPRRNLKPSVRALLILGALAYAERADTVALARMMSASTRTIKRACALLEADGLVVATRRDVAPTIWVIDRSSISAHERSEIKAMFLAWLAVGHADMPPLADEDNWHYLSSRARHYARHDDTSSPRMLAAVIADEVKAYAHKREQALDAFFGELARG